jgi:hypothetical protein
LSEYLGYDAMWIKAGNWVSEKNSSRQLADQEVDESLVLGT